ncbi:hypothetical protein ATCC51562_1032 [Campylobacter concisus ATCC 51562]|uniref:Uncharacterized protein n=1 Tax=Campylobacter concisus ATCC 51562 TaxID=1242969 RepID=U2GFL0_9BACT|nr:hypothetical protein ATCC51562_1032 [Campylobacter concisus ATCC 51562]
MRSKTYKFIFSHLFFNFKKHCYKYHKREFEIYEAFYFRLRETAIFVLHKMTRF